MEFKTNLVFKTIASRITQRKNVFFPLKFQYYEQLHKRINCEGLFTNPDMDALSEYETPPKFIPNYL